MQTKTGPKPLAAVLLFFAVFAGSLWLIRGCANEFGSAAEAVRAGKAADDAVAFTINEAERARCESILNEAKKSRCLSVFKVSTDKQDAELHILPAFERLHPDTKSKFFRAAYHSAFGLPLSTKRFSRLMYVIDAGGNQIQTLDLNQRGTEFR